jgi:uncharacterized protein (TIGR03083 family)
MDPADHVRFLRADSAALVAACEADLDAEVPSCPGWDRAALLAHTGLTHAGHLAQIQSGPAERVPFSSLPPAPTGAELPEWFAAGSDALATALEGIDPTLTWSTWRGPQPSSFFARRMAHETAVHRWDVDPTPMAAELAVDGVDELLEVFAPLIPGDRLGGAAGTIHLHATDDGLGEAGEWMITLGPDGIRSEHGHAKGDVAVRGAASDLLLWSWNRVPVDDRFQVFGDAALLEVWGTSVAI